MYSTTSWEWGRWLLFILCIAFILFNIFLANSWRRKRGRNPIVGTSWLAPPPSYGQSQRQYNNPIDENPVPQYSERLNENDAGYFDNEGKFHPSAPNTSTTVAMPAAAATAGPRSPPDMHPQQTSASPLTTSTSASTSTSTSNSSSSSSIQFTRPSVPPPSAAVHRSS